MNKISILGCGWLGSKIATYLIGKGNLVNGSTTKPQYDNYFERNKIRHYIINIQQTLEASLIDADFFNCDVLIISLAPSRHESDKGFFVNQIKVCASLAKKFNIKQVIFISSTSIYGDAAQIAIEESELNPTLASGISLKEAENILRQSTEFNTTILRLGGLIGYDRNPVETVSKQKTTGSLYVPVNLVHADDVVLIIEKIIEKNSYNETFNAVADHHPLRIQYYQKAYELTGKSPKPFEFDQNLGFKIIDNTKIKKALNYEFSLNNPLDIYTYKTLLTEF
jgi:nucleoside-diphosphate-sugar epimerase